jgi:hypothetical protein
VAGLKFGVGLRDFSPTKILTKLCTIPSANTWTLISLPNLPVWPSGNFSTLPGNIGYLLEITLAAGATWTSPANDTWQSGAFFGAIGQSNFFASAVNSTFDIAFVQHEPGAVCSTLIDKPFSQNLNECQRYFQKSYPYGTALGTATAGVRHMVPAGATNPWHAMSFKQTMAKAPTVTGYSLDGTINNVKDQTAGANRAITAALDVADYGFNGFTVTGGVATLWQAIYHYTADVGW